ncbi:hypothetical protein BC829DRAFT_408584 [Chytridium lagenaria]|nr:hypothetical protein BC829DRAFT_408584 [Chytridium lagenaria]
MPVNAMACVSSANLGLLEIGSASLRILSMIYIIGSAAIHHHRRPRDTSSSSIIGETSPLMQSNDSVLVQDVRCSQDTRHYRRLLWMLSIASIGIALLTAQSITACGSLWAVLACSQVLAWVSLGL